MNQEFKNIWKFLRTEEIGLARMAVSMMNGIKDDSENVASYYELETKVFNVSGKTNETEFHGCECSICYNKNQVRIWYWFLVIALLQDREIKNCLEEYHRYEKELKNSSIFGI